MIRVSAASLAAVAVVALNPMLLTMSASVQNDSLALLLGVLVILLAVAVLGERPDRRALCHRRSRRRRSVDEAHGLGRRCRRRRLARVGSPAQGAHNVVAFSAVHLQSVAGGSYATSFSTVTRQQRRRSNERVCRSTAIASLAPVILATSFSRSSPTCGFQPSTCGT